MSEPKYKILGTARWSIEGTLSVKILLHLNETTHTVFLLSEKQQQQQQKRNTVALAKRRLFSLRFYWKRKNLFSDIVHIITQHA